MSETPNHPLSYCATCDKPPNGCDHNAHRYLDPPLYERTIGGWKISNQDRERFNNDTIGQAERRSSTDLPEPKLLRDILTDLEPHVFLSADVKTLLHDAYETNAHATTLIAGNVKRNAATLNNPSGLLVTRLRQVVTYE